VRGDPQFASKTPPAGKPVEAAEAAHVEAARGEAQGPKLLVPQGFVMTEFRHGLGPVLAPLAVLAQGALEFPQLRLDDLGQFP
jgi:hypothetical protein